MAEKEIKQNTTEVSLNPKVWDVEYNADLVAQVLYVFLSNERKGTSNAKGRGDVSGGGRKPWKQKGTGRARHGSIRSPLWVGGGVTFGPSNKNWKRSINKKMVQKATCIMLSKRLKEEKVTFVSLDESKEIKNIRKSVNKELNGKTLVVSGNTNVDMAVRNIENVNVINPMNLNVKDIVRARKLLIDNDSVKILETRLTNGK